MHGRTPLSARPHSILPHHIPKRRQRGIQRRTSIPRHHPRVEMPDGSRRDVSEVP
jgi:hypothetical protein